MTLKLNNIAVDTADTMQLIYHVITTPNPLQISSTGSITVVVYKSGPPAVQCNSLTFTVLKGGFDTDLTSDPSTITTSCPPGWNVTSDGSGSFTFTPTPGNGTIGGTGLSFEFNNIAVNNQVGGTPLQIQESITLNNQPQINRTSFTLSKFPQDFKLQYLNVKPTTVAPGGTVNVSWSGSANTQDVTYDYSLSYGTNTISNLPNVDNYPVENVLETTVFTLSITAGGSTLYQQQKIVTVGQPVIDKFVIVGNQAQYPKFLVSTPIQLCWTTENVDYCILSLNNTPIPGSLSANETAYPITVPSTPGSYQYTLAGFKDNIQSQLVEVAFGAYSFQVIKDNIPNVGSCPDQILVSPDGSYLYIGGNVALGNFRPGLDHCYVVSTANDTIAKDLMVAPNRPSFALAPDGSHVYFFNGQFMAIDTSNYQLSFLNNIPPDNQDAVLAVGSTNYLVVAGSSIHVYDLSNNCALVKQQKFNGNITFPLSIVGNPQGNQFLIVMAPGGVYKYDLDQNEVSNLSKTARVALFNQDGTRYYLADPTNNTGLIEIRDATNDSLIRTVSLPASPLKMVLHPDGTHLFLIVGGFNRAAQPDYHTVVWADATDAGLAGAMVALEFNTLYLTALAVDPHNKLLYVADSDDFGVAKVWKVDISEKIS